jgi:hypothetical protein
VNSEPPGDSASSVRSETPSWVPALMKNSTADSRIHAAAAIAPYFRTRFAIAQRERGGRNGLGRGSSGCFRRPGTPAGNRRSFRVRRER